MSFQDADSTAVARFLQHGHYVAEQRRQGVHRDTALQAQPALHHVARDLPVQGIIFFDHDSLVQRRIWFLLSVAERARK